MPDGTKIAVDVLLPGVTGQNLTGKHDVALIQCRYMRGLALRWPLSLLSGRRPIDLIQQDLKLALLRDNYAVVSIDVRGTGTNCSGFKHNLLHGVEMQVHVKLLATLSQC